MKTTALVAAAVAALAVVALGPGSAQAAGAVQFSSAHYDSPGADTGSNKSLNAEYVTIKNTGSTARVLTGWRLSDAQGHVYVFPTFTLKAGAKVNVHSGAGTNTAGNLYWGSDWYIWNNTSDTATLKSSGGTLSDTCKWTSLGSGGKVC